MALQTNISTSPAVFIVLVFGGPCAAENEPRFQYEMTIEVGAEGTSGPGGSATEAFVTSELGLEYAFHSQLTGFADLTFESAFIREYGVRSGSNTIEADEFGLIYSFGTAELSFGKISPRFGFAGDTLRGYFSSDLVDEYEIEKARGVVLSWDTAGGNISFSASQGGRLASHDDLLNPDREVTLSRGRPSTFAIQYDFATDVNTYHIGARTVSHGEDGDDTEHGLALGFSTKLGNSAHLLAEVAAFDHWRGAPNKAVFATLGVSIEKGPVTYSGSYSGIRTQDGPNEHLLAIGIDWEIDERTALSAGYSSRNNAEGQINAFGMAVEFTIGN